VGTGLGGHTPADIKAIKGRIDHRPAEHMCCDAKWNSP